MTLGDLAIIAGAERVNVPAVDPAFGTAHGAEVAITYDPPATATLHVYAREIADGALSCSFGARRAAVTMDLALAARIVVEGLARGLMLPQDETTALAEALTKQQG